MQCASSTTASDTFERRTACRNVRSRSRSGATYTNLSRPLERSRNASFISSWESVLLISLVRLRNSAGEVIIVPNGQINKAINLSKDWARAVIDVPVPVTADISEVNEILHDVGVAAYKDGKLRELLLDEPSVMGVESLEVDQVSIRVVARTLPGKQFQVGRALRARIAAALRRKGITVTPQLDTVSVVNRAEEVDA